MEIGNSNLEVCLSCKDDLERFEKNPEAEINRLVVDFSGLDVKKKYAELIFEAVGKIQSAVEVEVYLSECNLIEDFLRDFFGILLKDFQREKVKSVKIDVSENLLTKNGIFGIFNFCLSFANIVKLEILCNYNEDVTKGQQKIGNLEEKIECLEMLKFFKIEVEGTVLPNEVKSMMNSVIKSSKKLTTLVMNLSQSGPTMAHTITKIFRGVSTNPSIVNFHLDITSSNFSKNQLKNIFSEILKISKKLQKFKFLLNDLKNFDDDIARESIFSNEDAIESLELGKDRDIKFRDTKISYETIDILRKKNIKKKEERTDLDDMLKRFDEQMAELDKLN